jgi:hypothetical protein
MHALRKGSLSLQLLRVAGFLALANLPFWILSEHFFVLRPLVNIDVSLALLVWTVSPTAGLVCSGHYGGLTAEAAARCIPFQLKANGYEDLSSAWLQLQHVCPDDMVAQDRLGKQGVR